MNNAFVCLLTIILTIICLPSDSNKHSLGTFMNVVECYSLSSNYVVRQRTLTTRNSKSKTITDRNRRRFGIIKTAMSSDNNDNINDDNRDHSNNLSKAYSKNVVKNEDAKKYDSCGRRSFVAASAAIVCSTLYDNNSPSFAAVTDETDTFATNWWTTPPSSSSITPSSATTSKTTPASASDEVSILVNKKILRKEKKGLGIELSDIEFRTNLRVYVKSIQSNSYAKRLGIQPDWILIGINDRSMERTNAPGVAQYLYRAMQDDNSDTIVLRFRDPALFREKLSNLSSGEPVTTQVAPAGDTTQYYPDGVTLRDPSASSQRQDDQQIRVSQLVAPKLCTKGGAQIDDLLEISYIGTIVETGQIFDGSAIKINNNGIPGRGDDVTLYFVLGKQPFGQFPPGWDVGLYGICVGERRRILIPPVLAYGRTGVPRRNIPPNATLQYDITLVSINGLSTIQ